MISANDQTILAMLSRYPGMSRREADSYLSRIDAPDNVQVAQAVIGRITRDQLSESARAVFDDFSLWSSDRTRRFLNEQVDDRRHERETKIARQLLKMKERGQISEEVLIIYGISGDLPDRRVYDQMSQEEQRQLWTRRMVERFGDNWQSHFSNLPVFVKEIKEKISRHDWQIEGF